MPVRVPSRRSVARWAVVGCLVAPSALWAPRGRADDLPSAGAPSTRPASDPQAEADRREYQKQRRYRARFDESAAAQLLPPGAQDAKRLTPAEEAERAADAARDEADRRRADDAARGALGRPLRDMAFEGADLPDAIDAMRDATGLVIYVNWKALEKAGVRRDVSLTYRVANGITLGRALEEILAQVGGERVKLGYAVDEGVVSVSTASDLARDTLTRVYDVRDLIGSIAAAVPGRTRMDAVELLIRRVQGLAPTSFKEFGGDVGVVKELSGQLIVTQTPEVHARILALLESTRASSTTRPATGPTSRRATVIIEHEPQRQFPLLNTRRGD